LNFTNYKSKDCCNKYLKSNAYNRLVEQLKDFHSSADKIAVIKAKIFVNFTYKIIEKYEVIVGHMATQDMRGPHLSGELKQSPLHLA
jgi:hypothetical protein